MTVDVKDIKETLDRQIVYNTAIAEEGLRGDYGANIGSVLWIRMEMTFVQEQRQRRRQALMQE